MAFLNTELLKQFGSQAANTLQSPNVVGAGIAGLATAGMWSLIKNTKKRNEDIVDSNTILNKKPLPTRLKSQVSPIDRYLLNNGINAYQQTVIGLLARLSSPVQSPQKTKQEHETGTLKKIGVKLGFDYNPVAQFLAFVTTGAMPKTIRKVYGLDSKKEEKSKIKTIQDHYHVSSNVANLVREGYGRSLLSASLSPQQSLVRLAEWTGNLMAHSTLELMTIRKALGVQHLPGVHERVADQDSWLGKMSSTAKKTAHKVGNLPGIDAVKNIARKGLSVIEAPFKIASGAMKFFETLTTKTKGFLSGRLMYAQTDEELAKRSGRVLKDFVKDGGLAEGISGITFNLQKIYMVGYKTLQVLEKMSGVSVGKKDLEDLDREGQQVYNPFTGQYGTEEQVGMSRKIARRAIYMSSVAGIIKTALTRTKG